jgi:multidrug efflux system outer membrane protein
MRMPRPSASLLSGATVCLLLSGCAARAPKSSGNLARFDLPDAFATNGERMGGTDHDWIRSFGNARLTDLVDKVLENNFDLEVAAARVEQAGADARIAGSRMYPLVSGALNGKRQKQSFIGFPFGGNEGGGNGVSSSQFNNFGLSLNVNWELDLWGRIRAGQSAALAELEASEAEMAGLQSSLAGQAAKIAFALVEAQQQVELARRSLASLRDSEQIVRDQFEITEQPASQLRLILSDVAAAQGILEEREEAKRRTSRQLAVLLGRYPDENLDAGNKLPEMPPTPPAGIPSDVLYRRYDLIAAERRVAATDKRILEAKLALLPQIGLTGSGGTTSDSLSNLLKKDYSVWGIGAEAAQTFFAGGEILGNLDRRDATQREALAQYQTSALKAFGEVEDTLDADRSLRIREQAVRESESLLVEAYESARQEYVDGVGDVLTLLIAQRNMIEVQAQVLTIRRLRLDNRVDLHLALGGAFSNKKAPEPRRTSRKES